MGKYINTNDLELEVSHYLQCEKESKAITLEELKEIINRLPSDDVAEVKHREWKTDRKEIVVRYGDEYEVHIPYCSECGWKRSNVYEYLGPGKVKWNFCPNCGADMRGETE